ncbi:hypothetical protein [Alkalicoccus chagannorensis]|uniref:hypothetical protein n=1 Tax=Alkalicoccus chagannorensis TaxID=427072 RepID=UPI0003FC4D39|nr:hypothetical protein [Alkalicoccus chagannorensis]
MKMTFENLGWDKLESLQHLKDDFHWEEINDLGLVLPTVDQLQMVYEETFLFLVYVYSESKKVKEDFKGREFEDVEEWFFEITGALGRGYKVEIYGDIIREFCGDHLLALFEQINDGFNLNQFEFEFALILFAFEECLLEEKIKGRSIFEEKEAANV